MSGAASRRHQTAALVKWVFAQRGVHDGNSISRDYRQTAAQDCTSLTYGEVDERSFLTILELVKPQPGEHFVDLGSGRGKVRFFNLASEPFIASSANNHF
jgi:Histone methylation protein DOT1